MSRIGSAMGMEHAEEEGSSKHKTLVYRKIPDISPARSEGMGSAVQIVGYTKVEAVQQLPQILLLRNIDRS
jgi:hypothetical protein